MKGNISRGNRGAESGREGQRGAERGRERQRGFLYLLKAPSALSMM
jgi:hypothetical protein